MMRKDKDKKLATRTDRESETPLAYRSPRSIFEEWDRWFDEFRTDFENRFWNPLLPTSRTASMTRAPLVDVLDRGRDFVVRAELPGVDKEGLDVRVSPEGIEIRAQSEQAREENERDYYYHERAYRAFERTLPFPEEVLSDQAEAKLKAGVLEVRVPKKEPSPRKEPVKVRVE